LFFFTNGYSVAKIEYRLVNQENATAAIEDIKCTLLYLVHYAERFQIDTNRIVLMGSSACGHLALVDSLHENNSNFDKNSGNLILIITTK